MPPYINIASYSPDRLLVQVRPWLAIAVTVIFGAGLIIDAFAGFWAENTQQRYGVFFMGVFLFGLQWWHGAFVDITFDRKQDKVSRSIRRLGSSSFETFALADIEEAVVEVHSSPRGRSYRLGVKRRDGTRPLEAVWSMFNREHAAREINGWLRRARKSD